MLFSTLATFVFTVASVASASSDNSADFVPVLQRRYNHRQHSQARSQHANHKSRTTPKKAKTCTAKPKSGSGSTNSTTPATGGSSSGSGSSSSGSGSGSTNSTGATTPSSGTKSGGVVHLISPECGHNDPSPTPGMTVGPMGTESWLNCGLDTSSGWNPPTVSWENLIYVTVEEALAKSPSLWAPCQKNGLVSLFNEYGTKNGIPPIMLMAFAMQESTCSQSNGNKNPYGTSGVFQIAPENCKGMDCRGNVRDNFQAAVNVILSYYKQYGNSVVWMAGAYNGWEKKMTLKQVKSRKCGVAQNGDYPHQLLNGFMQGIDGGKLGNIKNCGDYGRKRSLHVPRWMKEEQPQAERLGWSF